MIKFTRRAALLGFGGLAGWGLSGLYRPDLPTYAGTSRIFAPEGQTILNDASGLSATPIHKHLHISDRGSALVETIRREMRHAKAAGHPLNVGAARHSMGGQAIPRAGTAITFENAGIEIDSANQVYRAHAGARWSDVIAALDPLGWSPKVMQSNNDFGLAATYSVNAHGWPVPFGPMGSTVRSVRMVLPSGDLVTCSPTQNTDLFNLAMGGYGLIGVIVDMDIEMVRNTRLKPTYEVMPAQDYANRFKDAIQDKTVTMAYGRLNVERHKFFEKALLVTYRETEDQAELPAASGSGWMAHVASRIYRAQLGNEALKSFRWWNETSIGPTVGSGAVTRNALINEPVVTLDDRDPDRTDILHEYFVGFDSFDRFIEACRAVIPASYQEFLNVTLRYVAQDDQSVLSFARTPRIAAVMSFSRQKIREILDMQMAPTRAGQRSGYTPDEIEGMERVVLGTPVTNRLRKVGQIAPTSGGLQRILGMGAAMTAGITQTPIAVAAAAGAAGGEVAKALAQRATKSDVDDLLKTILNGGTRLKDPKSATKAALVA